MYRNITAICILLLVFSCEFSTNTKPTIEEANKHGYLKPSYSEKAGDPSVTTINKSSLRITPIKGEKVRARTPKPIPYRDNITLAKSPQVSRVDYDNLEIILLGDKNRPLPRKVVFPKSGYDLYEGDTIFAPTYVISQFPKPVIALPMRFKDAATVDIKYLDADQGMPSAFIYSIMEDSKGNIWFGTYGGGVTKYDGKSFYIFNKKKGLNNNRIRKIFEDSKGNIWLASNGGGMTMYDGVNFTTYTTRQGLSSDRIYTILEDRSGSIWIGTNGGGVTKYDGKSFTIYNKSNGLCGNKIYSLAEDTKGNIWMGSGSGGVSRFDGKSFTNFSEKSGFGNQVVRSILVDRKGNIWFGRNGGGITKYNGNIFETYTTEHGLSSNDVLSLLEDENDNIWIGTYSTGVNKFDGKRFTNYTEKEGLSDNAIMSLYEDSNGKIWMGTNGGGVSKLDVSSFEIFHQEKGLGNHTIRAIVEANNGDLWFGTDGGGISKFDGDYFNSFTVENGLNDNGVYCMTKDSKGQLWVGTRRGGVSMFDGKNFTSFSEEQGLENNNIRSLLVDKNQNVWFGSYGNGAFKYDGETITVFSENEGLKNSVIRAMFEDNKGNIWFGTDGGGVSKFDGNRMTTYTESEGLSNNIVMSIYQDSQDNMWFGTWGGGLSKFDGVTFNNYTEEDGLTHDLIFYFAEDKYNNLWVGTANGVNILNNSYAEIESKSTYKHRKLTKSDGLKEIDIALNSVLIDKNDRILWGLGKGYTSIDINGFDSSHDLSDVQLNSIEINQEFIDFRMLDSISNDRISKVMESSLGEPVPFYNYPTSLNLPYDFNHLSFNFSASDWLAPQSIQYQYKMEGLDTQWSTPNSNNIATYRNIPYGSYNFKVRAIGSDKWGKSFEYEFTIAPPWWHTVLARVIFILLIAYSIYRYVNWRTAEYKQQQAEMEVVITERIEEVKTQAEQMQELNNRLNLLNENLELKVEKRTAELNDKNKKLADYAFTNAHELRAPIANLLGLIQLFDDKSTEVEIREYVAMLKTVTTRLDEITYEIRDKLESEGYDMG